MTVIRISLHNINPVSLCLLLANGLILATFLYVEHSGRMRVTKIYLKTTSNASQAWGERIVSGFCCLFWTLLTCLHGSSFRVRTLIRKAIKTGQKCLQRLQKMKNLVHLWAGENKANVMTRLVSFLWPVSHMEFLQTRCLIAFPLLEQERYRRLSTALADVIGNTLNVFTQYLLLRIH